MAHDGTWQRWPPCAMNRPRHRTGPMRLKCATGVPIRAKMQMKTPRRLNRGVPSAIPREGVISSDRRRSRDRGGASFHAPIFICATLCSYRSLSYGLGSYGRSSRSKWLRTLASGPYGCGFVAVRCPLISTVYPQHVLFISHDRIARASTFFVFIVISIAVRGAAPLPRPWVTFSRAAPKCLPCPRPPVAPHAALRQRQLPRT